MTRFYHVLYGWTPINRMHQQAIENGTARPTMIQSTLEFGQKLLEQEEHKELEFYDFNPRMIPDNFISRPVLKKLK